MIYYPRDYQQTPPYYTFIHRSAFRRSHRWKALLSGGAGCDGRSQVQSACTSFATSSRKMAMMLNAVSKSRARVNSAMAAVSTT